MRSGVRTDRLPAGWTRVRRSRARPEHLRRRERPAVGDGGDARSDRYRRADRRGDAAGAAQQGDDPVRPAAEHRATRIEVLEQNERRPVQQDVRERPATDRVDRRNRDDAKARDADAGRDDGPGRRKRGESDGVGKQRDRMVVGRFEGDAHPDRQSDAEHAESDLDRRLERQRYPIDQDVPRRSAGERGNEPDDGDAEQVELLADRLGRPDQCERDEPDRVHHGERIDEQRDSQLSSHWSATGRRSS